MKMSFKVFVPAVAVAAGILFSCAGSGSKDIPDWLVNYPSDNAYYVGIGGSNTGNLADDREKAASAARADLASQISTEVRSELNISTTASSEDGFSESMDQTINESVEQNLQSVQTVDAWISPERGAWVYVRLSKAEWAAIVNREITDLTLRANTALGPLAAGNQTEAEELSALARTREVLRSSPWGLRVKDEVLGTGGFLREAVDAALSERCAGLAVGLELSPRSLEYGENLGIRGSVLSGAGRKTGTFPMFLTAPGGYSYAFTTDPDGRFAFTLSSAELGTDAVQVTAIPDIASLGVPADGFAVTDATVEAMIMPIPARFIVNSEAFPDLARYSGSVEDWFSDMDLPVAMKNSGAGLTEIEFAWSGFDYPRMDSLKNAPYMSEVGAIVTIRRDGVVLAVAEVEAWKDGGLKGWEQAHQRAAEGLLKQMGENPGLRTMILELLGR